MRNVGTLEQAILAILETAKTLSDESGKDIKACAEETFEIESKLDSKDGDMLEHFERTTDVMIKQMEIDRRTKFLDSLITWIVGYAN